MKIDSIRQTYALDGAGIDQLSEEIDRRLAPIGIERENRLRIRLSMEEALLRMRDHFGEDNEVTLTIGARWARPYVQIELEGAIFNPLSKTAGELEDWSGQLLTAVGLAPQYSYNNGTNTLRLTLPRQGMNPVLKMFIALAAGLVLGALLAVVLPGTAKVILNTAVFEPLYDAWYRVLTVSAGPVIFFMTITTTINTGKIAEQGGDSRRMVARYISVSMLLSVLALLLSQALFRLDWEMDEMGPGLIRGLFENGFSIIPGDIFSPLIMVSTPQILLLALVLGNLLFAAGERAGTLSHICRQFNTVSLLLADLISRLVPYMVFLFAALEIAHGDTLLLRGLWKPILLALVLALLIAFCGIFFTGRHLHVRPNQLWKTVRPVFLKTIRKGSLDASFALSETVCVQKLGIEKTFVTVGLPHGLVLFMPISALGTLVFTMYTASVYDLEVSLIWYLMVLVLATLLFVATPPVPGANLLAYAALFVQFGFPSVALIDAMIFDIFFGIFAAAANQLLLELDMTLQAARIGLLDEERLQRAAEE